MASMDARALEEENQRLKKELAEMQSRSKQEKSSLDDKVNKERSLGKAYSDQIKQKESELASLRQCMSKMSRQLDEQTTKTEHMEAQCLHWERKLHDMTEGGVSSSSAAGTQGKSGKINFDISSKDDDGAEGTGKEAQVSVKLMRVVQQWLDTKDLQQALLRSAGITDVSFSTLVQVLNECRSLSVLDLGQNMLSMDSCSDICRLITTSPALSFVSLAENLFSLRAIGYFMTAVMERQNKKRLAPLEVLDLDANEGIVAAASAPVNENLLNQVNSVLGGRLPPKGPEVVAQVMKALWSFLHYTEHPQVTKTNSEEVAFHFLDTATLRKMENALTKIMIVSDDTASLNDGGSAAASEGGMKTKAIYANVVLLPLMDAGPADDVGASESAAAASSAQETSHRPGGYPQQAAGREDGPRGGSKGMTSAATSSAPQRLTEPAATKPSKIELRDPFADLKTAFEPPKEKLKTFNLKQIVTRNGTVLMNMLERLLETTEIDARDVETDQTLLEYACQTGNMGLAKLCYRRGANLSARTKKGDSYFNIVTRNKRYDLMEFLHTYGVKVNHQDADGVTALHVAASNDDVDAICRLLEWGADVNLHDFKKRTPLHYAARSGHMQATMLLLEVGADMNAKDEKEYTAVAHAEAENNFALMDRLVDLGGKGHGLAQKGDGLAKSKTNKSLGELTVSASTLKASPLGRIGKVACKDLPGQLTGSLPGK
eukprot:TRINITY_DN54805_c0_g1_i1.p1 TRINITY_DN54805_c0_g1~~TRINITY_DN54805_c0_g1_i1.p1  ORF type:complete len:716 (-),score=237.03 TRINITY_DN54805_c0_g1_i1:44-2191(-)